MTKELPQYFVGSKVSLRALEAQDVPKLAAWINDERISGMDEARFPVSVAEEEVWYERVTTDVSKKKLVVCNDGEQDVGLVSLHDIDKKNQRGEVGCYIDPAHRRRGYSREALDLLIRFAFEELNLRKVSASILAFNEASLSLFRSLGFEEEGVRRQHVFTRGKFEDLVEMAKFREDAE